MSVPGSAGPRRVLDEPGEIDLGTTPLHGPSHHEHVLRQGTAPRHRVLQDRDRVAGPLGQVLIEFDDGRMATDRRQDVVQVVGELGGDQPGRLELPRIDQRCLHRLGRREVGHDTDHAERGLRCPAKSEPPASPRRRP